MDQRSTDHPPSGSALPAGPRHRAVRWRYRTAVHAARALNAIAAATEPRRSDQARGVPGSRARRA